MSEFGKGLVVCLAKFSEHMGGSGAYSIRMIHQYDKWRGMSPAARESVMNQARIHPHGDAAEFMRTVRIAEILPERTADECLSHLIEMWLNAASDHLYEVDESAPEPLKELANLALVIGHGFTGTMWTMEHVKKIQDLWKESCLALDERLGVETDWGEY